MTSAAHINFLGLTVAVLDEVNSAKPIIQKILERPRLLQSRPGNFLVCPLSVEIILALTQVGARGKTSKEISNALQLPHSPDRIQLAFLELSENFQHRGKYYLNAINRIFVKNGLKLDDQFRIAANVFFSADIQSINFQNGDEASDIINKWIAATTNNRIDNLLRKDTFDENTRMILINSTIFRGRSTKMFSFKATDKKPFFLNKNDYVDVVVLESVGYFNYYQDPELEAKFLEIPHEGDDIVSTVVLPNDKTGLARIETNIAHYFEEPHYRMEPVHVQLPKTKVGTLVEFNEIVRGMGVNAALEDYADFSGICDEKKELKINNILHNTIIKIEEMNTKDQVSDILTSSDSGTGQRSLLEPIQFHANHPFMFYLKHRVTGIFFIGRFYTVDGIIKSVKQSTLTS